MELSVVGCTTDRVIVSDMDWELFEQQFKSVKRTDVIEVPNIFRHMCKLYVKVEDKEKWNSRIFDKTPSPISILIEKMSNSGNFTPFLDSDDRFAPFLDSDDRFTTFMDKYKKDDIYVKYYEINNMRESRWRSGMITR